MKLELDTNDIQNILIALNATQIRGKDSMIALLKLIQKLEDALKPEKSPEE
jgi:hypothetical protein